MKYSHFNLFLIGCCFLCDATVFSARILFLFAGGNVSHKLGVWPFVRGLAGAGHNVTFVSSSDKKLVGSERVRDVTPAAFKLLHTDAMYNSDRLKDRLEGKQWDMSSEGYDMASLWFCETIMKAYQEDPEFREVIDNGHYDLVILNGIFSECGFFITHHLGLKVILYSPTTILPWFHGSFGAPVEASTIPEMLVQVSYPPTLLDRMWNVYRHSIGYNRRDAFSRNLEALFRQNFKVKSKVPSLVELERNVSLVFVNTHYSTDYARSLPPMFVSVGGMQCWEEIRKLPKVI